MRHINKEKCINCVEHKRCKENTVSWIFFIIGLIAIIAVRAVMILEHINPIYGKMSWYVGIIGFFMYFGYKYRMEYTRSQLIRKSGLIRRILSDDTIGREDRDIIGSVFCALSSNKDRINYLMIFVSSAIVLIMAFYMDFLR